MPNTKDLVFDVLLDSDRVLDDDGSSSSNNLKRVLKEYGPIIIKIVDGNVDRNLVEAFVDLLIKYNSVTRHSIGMGLVIGDSVTDDAKEYTSKISFHRKRVIDRLIVIVKPSPSSVSSPSQQVSVI